MNRQNHGLRLHFHGAAGTVTGSSTILRIKMGEEVKNILIDSGSFLDEWADCRPTQEEIHAAIISHDHADHIGETPEMLTRNKGIPAYVAKWSKGVASAMMFDAFKFTQKYAELWQLQVSEALCRAWLWEIRHWESQQPGKKKKTQNRKWSKKKSLPHESVKDHLDSIEMNLDRLRGLLSLRLGEEYYPADDSYEHLHSALERCFMEKKARLRERGMLTHDDVQRAVNSLSERTLWHVHRIFPHDGIDKSPTFRMLDSGHLITAPATQIMIRARGKNILFSGDRGNTQLPFPYSRPDDTGLSDKADFLILESTYGWREHLPREKELARMDSIILAAIEKWEDIIIPTISLDRPLIVMYEIVTRLIESRTIDPDKVEILFFGNLLEKLLGYIPRHHPMWQKIKNHIAPLTKDRLDSLESKWKKSRIILAGGWFLPTDGSPAWAVLERALQQDTLTIIFPNYHGGPNSNAGNLIAGKEFFLTRDNPMPHKLWPGHKAYYISGFSGHADTPELVSYAANVMRENGTIYLNHGTDEARTALRKALEEDARLRKKKVRILLPIRWKDYVLKK